jgi:hypothetical protein
MVRTALDTTTARTITGTANQITVADGDGVSANPTISLATRTFTVPVLNATSTPDTSGNVFVEPYVVKATNDFFKQMVWVYNDTSTDLYVYGSFRVPENFVSGAKLCTTWTSTATSGNVRWQVDYRSTGSTGGLDQATSEEQVEGNTAAPGAANNRTTSCLTLTDANVAASDTMQYRLGREGSDTGNDTMAAAAMVFNWYFEYQGR